MLQYSEVDQDRVLSEKHEMMPPLEIHKKKPRDMPHWSRIKDGQEKEKMLLF